MAGPRGFGWLRALVDEPQRVFRQFVGNRVRRIKRCEQHEEGEPLGHRRRRVALRDFGCSERGCLREIRSGRSRHWAGEPWRVLVQWSGAPKRRPERSRFEVEPVLTEHPRSVARALARLHDLDRLAVYLALLVNRDKAREPRLDLVTHAEFRDLGVDQPMLRWIGDKTILEFGHPVARPERAERER